MNSRLLIHLAKLTFIEITAATFVGHDFTQFSIYRVRLHENCMGQSKQKKIN